MFSYKSESYKTFRGNLMCSALGFYPLAITADKRGSLGGFSDVATTKIR